MRIVFTHFLKVLFVFISSVTCIKENDTSNDQSVVQGRYNFNRPPWAEDYNPIPVAVVYEDDIVALKTNKPETENNMKQQPVSNIDIVNQTSKAKQEPAATTTTEISTTFKTSVTDSEKLDVLAEPKARSLSDLQIPVAVIYDTIPDNIQAPQKDKVSETKNPRRRYKQIRRRQKQNKDNNNNEPKTQITEPTEPETEKFDKPPTPKYVEPIKLQRKVSNSLKTQSESEAVEEFTKRTHGQRERDPVVPIINSENYVYSHSGNFHYSYEAGDGTKAHSEGQLMRSENNEAAGEAVSGGFSYTDKEGNDFSLSYTADENGYRPIGAHLPTPPPIPPAIARALAYLATVTTPEPVTKPVT